MAGEAGHGIVGVGELCLINGWVSPLVAVALHRLREGTCLVVVVVTRCHGVEGLNDFPIEFGIDHRALVEAAPAPGKPSLTERGLEAAKIATASCRRRAAGFDCCLAAGRSVAVDTVHLDGVANFAVEIAVTVVVLLEMAIDAVHSFFQVNVLQVNGLGQLVRIIRRDFIVICIEKISVAIFLEDSAEEPAVALKLRKLHRVEPPFHFLVEVGGLLKKFRVAPLAP